MNPVRPTSTILFLSHGGGPLPLLGDPGHQKMVGALRGLAAGIPRPTAILVISAHWEESVPTLTAAAAPSLLYDYDGFPPESYQIQYPCPGSPALAQRVHDVLSAADMAPRMDAQRGLDHGVFVPLKIMFPEADIPCVQLSLLSSLDPQFHLQMGEALRALDEENLLVIGSGFSFHNMRAFFSPDTAETRAMNLAFEGWLQETCHSPALSEAERRERLLHWAEEPHARYCHPREEHLLPLHVCQGLAGTGAANITAVPILGKQASMIRW
jgi:4,5-DOPA dioxygenase extradiol